MQVAQADVLRLVDDDRVGVRDVKTVLDYRGAKKHIVIPTDEIQHPVLQLLGFHLTMSHTNLHVRHKPVQNLVNRRKFLHFIMYEEELSATVEFIIDYAPDLILVEQDYLGLRRNPVRRGSVDDGQIPGPEQRELQGTRNRGGRQSQSVHRGLHLT